MTALAYSRTAALPLARILNDESKRSHRSSALASMQKPLLVSGVVTALAVPAIQLSLLGPVPHFASLWLENWLVAWAITAPLAYLLAPLISRAARFLSSPARTDIHVAGVAFSDIVSASTRASERHGFTVLRNLKVREDFYHS